MGGEIREKRQKKEIRMKGLRMKTGETEIKWVKKTKKCGERKEGNLKKDGMLKRRIRKDKKKKGWPAGEMERERWVRAGREEMKGVRKIGMRAGIRNVAARFRVKKGRFGGRNEGVKEVTRAGRRRRRE